MGLIPGAVVKVTKLAPLGDPMELLVGGYALSLRRADARSLTVEPAVYEEPAVPAEQDTESSSLHPGLGEGGKSL